MWEGVLKGGGGGGVVAVEKGSCVAGCGDVTVLAALKLWSRRSTDAGRRQGSYSTADNLVVSRAKVEGVAIMRWFRNVLDGPARVVKLVYRTVGWQERHTMPAWRARRDRVGERLWLGRVT